MISGHRRTSTDSIQAQDDDLSGVSAQVAITERLLTSKGAPNLGPSQVLMWLD